MMSRPAFLIIAVVLALPQPADAHWCHSLWGSAYNIVVRPEGDAVTSGTTGDGKNYWTLGVAIQNNMGYPLGGFAVTAQSSDSNFDVSIDKDAAYPAKKTNYLLPGEKIRYIVTATRHNAAQLDVASIQFYVGFGNNQDRDYAQHRLYGGDGDSDPFQAVAPSQDVVIRTPTGVRYPPDLDSNLGHLPYDSQGKSPSFSAQADHASTDEASRAGMRRLLKYYCTGGPSWQDAGQNSTCCTEYLEQDEDLITYGTNCSPSGASTSTSTTSNYTYEHLWSAVELGARKSKLQSMTCSPAANCLEVFRERLECAVYENTFLYKGMAYLVLGYLGPDTGARDLLLGQAGTGSPSTAVEYAARAALYVQGDASYEADVEAGVNDYSGSNSGFVKALCSAALGIAASNGDTYVQNLIDRVSWTQPNTSSDGTASLGFYNAFLLQLVSWDRRTWAEHAADTGYPSYYTVVTDETPPAAPTGFVCEETGSITAPALRLSWDQVTLDTDGGAENVARYRIDWGTSARTCSSPTDFDSGGDCGYQHTDTTTSGAVITYVPPGLSYTDTTYYFSVHAIDAAGNRSDFALPSEASCVARAPQHYPVAQINCTPDDVTVTQAELPQEVTCSCAASTDDDGDIATCTFRVDGVEAPAVAYDPGQYATSFGAFGSHVISLTVTDANGLTSSPPAQAAVVIRDENNAVPDAVPVADVTSGYAPLTVSFSDASTDADGDDTIASWRWVFWTGNESTEQNPGDVTFDTAGTYIVYLTVTDDQGATATDSVNIDVSEPPTNNPPDLQYAVVNPRVVAPNVDVTFNADAVRDPEDDNITFNWDFDDGSSSTESIVTHSYSAEGQYGAVLTAQDDGTPAVGPSTRTFSITVSRPVINNRQPDCATATVSPVTGEPPLTVTLDASGCTDADAGDTLRFDWSISAFGIQPIEISDAPPVTTFTLEEAADYEITLTATDDGSPPMQSRAQEFRVSVSTSDAPVGHLPPIVASCGCDSSSPTEVGFAALLIFGIGILRRRKS